MQQSRGSQCKLLVLLAILLAALAACSRDTPEAAVRKQVEAMQTAIDGRDAGGIDGLLAEDFVGNEGMDRRGARQLAAGVFLRYRDVGAKIGPVSVQFRGGSDAVARFNILATGGSGGLLPESGQVYEVETGWRLVDGEWRLLNAQWKPRL